MTPIITVYYLGVSVIDNRRKQGLKYRNLSFKPGALESYSFFRPNKKNSRFVISSEILEKVNEA